MADGMMADGRGHNTYTIHTGLLGYKNSISILNPAICFFSLIIFSTQWQKIMQHYIIVVYIVKFLLMKLLLYITYHLCVTQHFFIHLFSGMENCYTGSQNQL